MAKENIVYILGAGFSAPLGLPVIANFLEKAKDLAFLDNVEIPHRKEIIEKFERLRNVGTVCKSDPYNIEEIFSIIAMDEFLGGSKRQLIFRVKKFISAVIQHTTPKTSVWNSTEPPKTNHVVSIDKHYAGHRAFVASLFNLRAMREKGQFDDSYQLKVGFTPSNQQNKYDVLTMNYDTILEDITDSYNLFLEVPSMEKPSFNIISKDNKELQDKPNLCKLHGCVRQDNIIPPTWNKGNSEIKPIWSAAHHLLVKANRVRIIGYSLPETDSYFRYFLKSALAQCTHLKEISVYNLGEEARQTYSDFFNYPKFQYYNVNCSDYFKGLLNCTETRGKVIDQRGLTVSGDYRYNQLEHYDKSFKSSYLG